MNADANQTNSSFAWNKGGWFGSQLGSSVWMLLIGVVFLFQNPLFAMLSLACFVILNVYGYTLWQSRDRLPAYTAIQRFLLATTVIYAVMVVCFNCRVVAAEQVPANGLNENMPYWVIGLPPVLMLFFFAQERGLRGSRTETTSQKNDDLDATEQHGKT